MKVVKNGEQQIVSFNETDMSKTLNIEVTSADNCYDHTVHKYDAFVFSGGEQHVRFEEDAIGGDITVTARVMSANDIIGLLLIKDALDRMGEHDSIELVIPYWPYARQDRVCSPGEALSTAVMARLINSAKFDSVTIYDAHSDVSPALIDNVENVSISDLFESVRLGKEYELTLVSPDAGAAKKVMDLSKVINAADVIVAGKVRDVKTGDIMRTDVYADADRIEGKDLMIVDDICDGGRTFLELAKVLKKSNPKSITLYVTHGIFSKGIDVFDGFIDKIITTDSICQFKSNDKLTVIKL